MAQQQRDGEDNTLLSPVPKPEQLSVADEETLAFKDKPSTKRDLVTDTWLLDILALVGSLLSLLAIIILLYKADGKSFFHWYGLSINTIVSIFAAALKILIAFPVADGISQWKWVLFTRGSQPLLDFDMIDNASRGAYWSSIRILWRTKLRSTIVIGALITIFTVAIDPFIQQVIGLQSGLHFHPDNSTTLPYAKRYSRGDVIILDSRDEATGEMFREPVVWPSVRLQASTLSGISSHQSETSSSSALRLGCGSGNCTWEPFDSLAVCSACNDVSDQLVEVDVDSFDGPVYELPNGARLYNHLDILSGGFTHMATMGQGDRARTLAFRDNDLLIYALSVIQATNDAAGSRLGPSYTCKATECALYYCVNKYKSKVVSGILQETATPVSAPRLQDSWQLVDPLAVTDSSYGLTLPLNDSLELSLASALQRTDLQIGDGFNVSHVAVMAMSYHIKSLFNDTGYVREFRFTTESPGKLYYQPAVMQELWEMSDLEKSFGNLAASLSYHIRAESDGNPKEFGQLGEWVTLVQVRWPWLIFPVALDVAACVFLLLVAISSRRLKIPLWRSSSLPVLLRGPEVAEVLRGATLVSDMEKRAETAKWRL